MRIKRRGRCRLSRKSLAHIRAAHVERCQAAAARFRHRRGGEPEGLPDSLVDAGCWLVANGWDGEESAAESALGWGPARYRAFLEKVGPAVWSACIEGGRKALFEGRYPIFPAPAPSGGKLAAGSIAVHGRPMLPHMRAIVAASAYAILSGKKVAGIHDHSAGRHLRIAAECRGNRLQAYDGERSAFFGGELPDLYDQGDKAFVSLERDGATARGYDRATETFYTANVLDQSVQFYDHGAQSWFAYTVQTA